MGSSKARQARRLQEAYKRPQCPELKVENKLKKFKTNLKSEIKYKTKRYVHK